IPESADQEQRDHYRRRRFSPPVRRLCFLCGPCLFFFQLAPFLVLPMFLRFSLPSTFFLICTLSDFGFLLLTALSLSYPTGFGLSAFFRRQPLLLQCSTDVCAELFDP